ncbi:hypothetical protein [Haloechinothrix sp. LS1_15]|uniref:hypothetical protein n=1 Tax=Haloechinothrix sp. LS1_15 TaxID=2652248 RepID=UPI002944792D|nr:hypothetical protein [Haloechinothrix sp. LS1_15]MDV6011663.1 hypothetical protein [Haloechinothrix sp. LS1_15]
MTITGTRSTSGVDDADLWELFCGYVQPFTADGVMFYLGGAVGIDTIALHWLAENSNVAITVVVPCAVVHQPSAAADAIASWNEGGRVSAVVELGAQQLDTAAYHARNRWMVDRIELVIGFPRGRDSTSGTRYTLNYAEERGAARLVVPL